MACVMEVAESSAGTEVKRTDDGQLGNMVRPTIWSRLLAAYMAR
jgi:hypothetical protein